MKNKTFELFICTFVFVLAIGCINKNSSSSSPDIFTRETTPLPVAVETAANQMVSSYRLGGTINVQGIREIPNQNAAIADLQFDGFQYATDNEGGHLIEAAKYKSPTDLSKRNPTDPLPSMEEMFPSRKQTYNGQGAATLTKYSDDRWVLKDVRWGGGLNVFTVTGTIEIH